MVDLQRMILAGSAGLALMAGGCGMNNIKFDRYNVEAPLVVVSDGLFSTEARRFFRELCDEESVPYLGEDNVSWFKNKKAIEEAWKQKRDIILIGYSAGCHQAKLTAEWCNEKNIPVSAIFFDPTYLAGNSGKSIPGNVSDISVYLSERNIPDILAIGKGREIAQSDLRNPQTKYYNNALKGAHLDIFRDNSERLKGEMKKEIRAHRKITYPR